jgi:hypothetical protein
VGEFQAGNEVRGLAHPVEALGRGPEAGEDRLEIGGVHVVGDGQIPVALDLGPAPQFRRQKLPVAIKGMGVQVYHLEDSFLFSVFGFL